MQTDIYLVTGLVLALFAVPSMLGAFFDGRAPRASAIVIMIAGGLVWLAIDRKPGGYTVEDIPRAFMRVVAEIIR